MMLIAMMMMMLAEKEILSLLEEKKETKTRNKEIKSGFYSNVSRIYLSQHTHTHTVETWKMM